MAMERAVQGLDELNVPEQLLGGIGRLEEVIEKKLLEQSRTPVPQSLEKYITEYKAALAETANHLIALSRTLFKVIDIKSIRPNLNLEEMSDAYQNYLYASENLTQFVKNDILNEERQFHLIFKMDRWAYIASRVYKANDFFTMTCIITGICTLPDADLSLIARLSENGRKSINHFEKFLINQTAIYQLQKQRLDRGEMVVPVLATLTKMLDGVTNSTDERHIRHSSRTYSREFILMQATLKTLDDHLVDDLQKFFCQKPDTLGREIKGKRPRSKKKRLSYSRLARNLGKYLHEDGELSLITEQNSSKNVPSI